MIQSHWRLYANKVITEELNNKKPTTREEAKKLLSKVYPFGERAMHPYKIWLDAVHKNVEAYFNPHYSPSKQVKPNPNQTQLFGT